MSARERILREMKGLNWISWERMLQIGGVRYSARILELRRLGYKIEDCAVSDGKRYRLIDPAPGRPKHKQVKLYLPESEVEFLLHGNVTGVVKRAALDALTTFRANKANL